MKIYLLNVGELIRERDGSRIAELLPKLDEARREKVLAAKTPQTGAAELGAGLLLQKAVQDQRDQETGSVLCTVAGLASQLKASLPLTYRYGERGKPYFREIPLFFSLSHSGEYVLCAVSRREIGADIQKLQPTDVRKLAKRFYAKPEYLALERCETAEERLRLFFELWSRKEAWGKLTGEGITATLGQELAGGDAAQDMEWMAVLPPEGYAAAVCVRRGQSV